MNQVQITNRPGPNCELTIRIRFDELERFRDDYHKQLAKGLYFLKTKRSKPTGTRVQLIFILELEGKEPVEVWSWGAIEKVVTPEDARQIGVSAGMEIKLMDITAARRTQIEKLFGVDDAVAAVLNAHKRKAPASSPKTQHASNPRSPRVDVTERVRDLIRLAESDHYSLLGLTKDASEDQIRAAYRRRTKEFHPDQYYRKLPDDLLQSLQKAFQQLNTAYRTLIDKKRRVNYDISIGNYANPEAVRSAMPHVRRQKAFKKAYEKVVKPRNDRVQQLLDAADDDMHKAHFKSAQNKLQVALAMDPLNPTIKQKMKKVKELLSHEQG